MKKLVLISLLMLGFNFTSCEPESLTEQEHEQIESTDKTKVGTVGNSGGQDPDEDYN